MTLRILNVAYPFAPTGPNAVGGAEQVLSQIDRALVANGHRSYVLGCEGTRGQGTAFTAFPLPDTIDNQWKNAAYGNYRARIESIIDDYQIDLVHFHGVDFYEYLPRRSIPLLATLHLPVSWYPASVFTEASRNLWLHCVSERQHSGCPPAHRLLAPIANGVDIPTLTPRKKLNFVMSLGRICPEKGFHFAMEAARRAGLPFVLGGEVFPYEAHLNYFNQEIRPRLGPRCRYVGPLAGTRKLRYLQRAKCLLVSSVVPETSSLVAMEALACGTPVIAFACGALPCLIENGKTGFLVNELTEMAEAIARVDGISADVCRAVAKERFSATSMTAQYLERYRQIIESFKKEPAVVCA